MPLITNKYGNGTDDDENEEVVGNVEGLEPPMLDETWGLKDGEDTETSTPRVKRNHGQIDDQFKKDFDGGYLTLFSINDEVEFRGQDSNESRFFGQKLIR